MFRILDPLIKYTEFGICRILDPLHRIWNVRILESWHIILHFWHNWSITQNLTFWHALCITQFVRTSLHFGIVQHCPLKTHSGQFGHDNRGRFVYIERDIDRVKYITMSHWSKQPLKSIHKLNSWLIVAIFPPRRRWLMENSVTDTRARGNRWQ